ncbi:MAG: hypothetical protein ACRDTF_19845 [Pseudonocardiaceae bacterium]
MLSPQPELIWQGRIHLGDEPGVFGNAFYSGLATELPVTLQKTDPSGPDTTTLVVVTKNVETFSGYPGHLITVTLYEEDPGQPFHSIETVLATERLTSADNNHQEITINLTGKTSPIFISVRVRIDTEVPSGLYDDFVVTRLLNKSQNFTFVASLGFRA